MTMDLSVIIFRKMADAFVAKHGLEVLARATGQRLIVKK